MAAQLAIPALLYLLKLAVQLRTSPTLTLETGSSDVVVNYSSGTGSNILIFNYTVAAGHNSSDLEYVDTSSLDLKFRYC